MMGRGQTTIDFLVGTSVFLLVVAMIVLFVPGMIDPFATGTEDHAVTANRAVTSLSTGQLGDPQTPYILEQSATDDFFAQSESTIKSRLGLPASVTVNVTLTNTTGQFKAVGPVPPDHTSITTAWRVVYYQGDRAELYVRMW